MASLISGSAWACSGARPDWIRNELINWPSHCRPYRVPGVQSSSQPSTPPTHSTFTQFLPSSSEMFLKLLHLQHLRVLNVPSSHLFSLHTELSASQPVSWFPYHR